MMKKDFLPDMKKIFIVAALAVFVGHRLAEGLSSSGWTWPSIQVPSEGTIKFESLTPAQRSLWQTVATLRPEDKKICADFHASLARAVAADPAAEPVIKDTPALRRAYRAGSLFVWAGLAGNKAGKYPGLADALEATLIEAIGAEEVPINPTIRQSAVDCFNKVAAICTSARQ